MSYKIEWEANGIYWEYSGDVSGMEVFEASISAYGDSRFDVAQYKLVNFLNVVNLSITEQELETIAQQHRSAQRYNPRVMNAIVVKDTEKSLAHKFKSFFAGTGWKVRVFDNLDDANDWLGRHKAA